MARDIDFAGLVVGLSDYRARRGKASDAMRVMLAIKELRRTQLPECYVDGIQDELLQMVCDKVPEDLQDYVYLAFHGEADRATHMKIGVAKSVRKRMAALYTGNPLPRLWVFRAPFVGRHNALKAEKALLDHMADARTNGEWVSIGSVAEDVAAELVNSMGEVASTHVAHPVAFERV